MSKFELALALATPALLALALIGYFFERERRKTKALREYHRRKLAEFHDLGRQAVDRVNRRPL